VRNKNWKLRIDKNELEINKKTPDNRILNSRTSSKQRKYYIWLFVESKEGLERDIGKRS
jgi:hypothetical protein